MNPHPKKRIITIAGFLGSGKSSTARCVATELGYTHFSSGDLFRAVAAERGLSIEEINKAAELEKEIDYTVDKRLREMNDSERLVIDSRTAFHWIPASFKVYLSLDPHIASERIYKQIQAKGRTSQHAESVEDVYNATLERIASETKRYQDLYQLNVNDLSQYDLVIDTEHNDLDTVVGMVIKEYREWIANKV
ncbi:MAG TPA: AAA family ATPase [Candidatus Paceibacterota bacterium]|jgi:cytidylate kinase